MDRYRNKDAHVKYVCVSTHIFPSSVPREGLEAMKPQCQRSHLVPRSWFLNVILQYKEPALLREIVD